MIEEKEWIAAVLPGYELGARVGRGAFGLVLAGRHRQLHRDVAIKILSIGQDGDRHRTQLERGTSSCLVGSSSYRPGL